MRTENKLKTKLFENDDITKIMQFSIPRFPQKHKSKINGDSVAFLDFSVVMRTEKCEFNAFLE